MFLIAKQNFLFTLYNLPNVVKYNPGFNHHLTHSQIKKKKYIYIHIHTDLLNLKICEANILRKYNYFYI